MEVSRRLLSSRSCCVANPACAGNLDDPEDLSEATLDIELMMGLGTPNLTLQLYQIGGNDSSDYCMQHFRFALDALFKQPFP